MPTTKLQWYKEISYRDRIRFVYLNALNDDEYITMKADDSCISKEEVKADIEAKIYEKLG